MLRVSTLNYIDLFPVVLNLYSTFGVYLPFVNVCLLCSLFNRHIQSYDLLRIIHLLTINCLNSLIELIFLSAIISASCVCNIGNLTHCPYSLMRPIIRRFCGLYSEPLTDERSHSQVASETSPMEFRYPMIFCLIQALPVTTIEFSVSVWV